MTKYIEEQIQRCSNCKKKTIHRRSNSKSSGFMILVHLVLIISTAGIWLIVVGVWKLLTAKMGGWSCSVCGR